MNSNTAIWLVYRTDTNARGFSLVKRTLGWKNFMPENFLEINWYLALTSYCNTIGQCLLYFRVFFGWKTKRPCFDLFIHWLIKKSNTFQNHFSRSCENRSNQVRNWINWMILRSYANSWYFGVTVMGGACIRSPRSLGHWVVIVSLSSLSTWHCTRSNTQTLVNEATNQVNWMILLFFAIS